MVDGTLWLIWVEREREEPRLPVRFRSLVTWKMMKSIAETGMAKVKST